MNQAWRNEPRQMNCCKGKLNPSSVHYTQNLLAQLTQHRTDFYQESTEKNTGQ